MESVHKHFISEFVENPIINISELGWIDLNVRGKHPEFKDGILFKFKDGTYQTWVYHLTGFEPDYKTMYSEYERIKNEIKQQILTLTK